MTTVFDIGLVNVHHNKEVKSHHLTIIAFQSLDEESITPS